MNSKDYSSAPWLRSFGRIRARLQPHHHQLLAERLSHYALPENGDISLTEYFPQHKKFALEIGFGTGDHLLSHALANPEYAWVGAEPFLNGVAHLIAEADLAKLKNLAIWPFDVRLLLSRLPGDSIHSAFILFPDPWPKNRHHKRRLINADLIKMLARIFVANGTLQIATDDHNYAEWIIATMHEMPMFYWLNPEKSTWEKPFSHWQPTRYHEKANQAGRTPLFFTWQYRP